MAAKGRRRASLGLDPLFTAIYPVACRSVCSGKQLALPGHHANCCWSLTAALPCCSDAEEPLRAHVRDLAGHSVRSGRRLALPGHRARLCHHGHCLGDVDHAACGPGHAACAGAPALVHRLAPWGRRAGSLRLPVCRGPHGARTSSATKRCALILARPGFAAKSAGSVQCAAQSGLALAA